MKTLQHFSPYNALQWEPNGLRTNGSRDTRLTHRRTDRQTFLQFMDRCSLVIFNENYFPLSLLFFDELSTDVRLGRTVTHSNIIPQPFKQFSMDKIPPCFFSIQHDFNTTNKSDTFQFEWAWFDASSFKHASPDNLISLLFQEAKASHWGRQMVQHFLRSQWETVSTWCLS